MKSRILHSIGIRSWVTVCALVLSLGTTSNILADDLGEVLRECGWDRIIGTWVDQDTKGEKIRISYAWKYKDKVIQSNSRMGDIRSTSLTVLNPKTGEVHQVGANNRGGGAVGKWEIEEQDAVLRVSYVSENGDEGEMEIRHHLKDDDTMVVTIARDQPVELTLIRKD